MRELTFEEETAITLLETAVRLKPKATALKNGAEKLLSFLNSDRSERPKLTEKNIEELDTVLAKHGINLAVLLKTQPTTQAKQTPIVNPAMEAYKQAFAIATPIVSDSSVEQPKATVTVLNSQIETIKSKLLKLRLQFKLDDKANKNKNEWLDTFSSDCLDRIAKYGDRTKFTDKQIDVINKYVQDDDNNLSYTPQTNYTLADVSGNKLRELILHTRDVMGKYAIVGDTIQHNYSMLWNTQSATINKLLTLELTDAQIVWIVDFMIKLQENSRIVAKDHKEDDRRKNYFKCVELLKKLVDGLATKQDLLTKEDRVFLQSYVKNTWSNEPIQEVINRTVETQRERQ